MHESNLDSNTAVQVVSRVSGGNCWCSLDTELCSSHQSPLFLLLDNKSQKETTSLKSTDTEDVVIHSESPSDCNP